MPETFFEKNKNTIIIVGIVVLIVICLLAYLLMGRNKSEFYAAGDIPASAKQEGSCKIVSIPDMSESLMSRLGPSLKNADPTALANFNSALSTYKSALQRYNSYPNCSGVCVGGNINTSGHCICPSDNPIPYLHSDNNVYCISNDLSNITGSVFDPLQRKFSCAPGTHYNISGNNICFEQSSLNSVRDAMAQLNTAISTIQNSPSKVSSVFGQIGSFYISGQASQPSVSSKISSVSGVTSVGQAVSSAPSGTNVFVYNPQSSSVDYFSDSGVKITSLPSGTFTVGSTSY